MLFSDAKGRKVVSPATDETIAKVSDFVVNPATRSVVAIPVKKAKSGDTMRWDMLTAFGVDAVTLPSDALVTSRTPRSPPCPGSTIGSSGDGC